MFMTVFIFLGYITLVFLIYMAIVCFIVIPAAAKFDNENNHIILIFLIIMMFITSYSLAKYFIKHWKYRENAGTFESIGNIANLVEYTTLNLNNKQQEQAFFNQLYTVYIADISPNIPVTYYYPQEENIIEEYTEEYNSTEEEELEEEEEEEIEEIEIEEIEIEEKEKIMIDF